MSTQETTQTFSAIVNASSLQEYIGTLTPIVDEARIHLEDDGLQAAAVDPANVAMASVTLETSAFESYTGADGGLIGINLSRFEDVIGFANANDLVKLDLNPETRKLDVIVNDLEYTLALIDPDTIREEPEIPDLNHSASVTLLGSEWSRGLKAAEMVSDHITLSGDSEAGHFVLEATGDTDDAHLELADDDLVAADISEDAASMFSLDYLQDMETPIGSDAELRVELGDEFPVEQHLDIADGHGHLQYALAPRITSD